MALWLLGRGVVGLDSVGSQCWRFDIWFGCSGGAGDERWLMIPVEASVELVCSEQLDGSFVVVEACLTNDVASALVVILVISYGAGSGRVKLRLVVFGRSYGSELFA